jgi:predicted nucleic acid-binding protein
VTGEVFLDSGIFIAFLVRSDRFHEDAVALFSRPPRQWSTSVLIVGETYGWFLHRLGEEAARTFRRLVQDLQGLIVLGADARHQEAVWRKLDLLRGSGLTYVDASSLVWMEERKIRAAWGTDHHLALEGAIVAPGAFSR